MVPPGRTGPKNGELRMKLIRTAAVALTVGLAVAATAAPADAFFFLHHKDAKACSSKHPVLGFFEAIFGCKK